MNSTSVKILPSSLQLLNKFTKRLARILEFPRSSARFKQTLPFRFFAIILYCRSMVPSEKPKATRISDPLDIHKFGRQTLHLSEILFFKKTIMSFFFGCKLPKSIDNFPFRDVCGLLTAKIQRGCQFITFLRKPTNPL